MMDACRNDVELHIQGKMMFRVSCDRHKAYFREIQSICF